MRDQLWSIYKPFSSLRTTPVKSDASTILQNINISHLGSYVFKNAFVNKLPVDPQLPISSNGHQIFNLSDNNSNYELHYSATDLTQLVAESDATSGFADYFTASLKTAIQSDRSQKRTITLTAGGFSNKLAELFSQANRIEIATENFPPLLNVWNGYAAKSFAEDDKIIGSFKGLVIKISNNADWKRTSTFESEIKAGASLPFIKINAQGSGSWVSSGYGQVGENGYEIFFYNEDNNPNLVALPPADVILRNWERLRRTEIYYSLNRGRIDLLSQQKSYVEVEFGPISIQHLNLINFDQASFLAALSQEQKSFIRDFKILGDPIYITNRNSARIRFKIEANNFLPSTDDKSFDTDLTVSVGQQNNGKALSQKYRLYFYAPAKSIPKLVNQLALNVNSNNDVIQNYTWQSVVDFDNSDNIISNDYELVSNDPKINNLIVQNTLKARLDRIANTNQFNLVVSLNPPANTFTINDRVVSVALTMKLKTSKNNITSVISRSLKLQLFGIEPNANNQQELAIKTKKDFFSIVSTNLGFPDNKKLVDLMNDFKDPTTQVLDSARLFGKYLYDFRISVVNDSYLMKPSHIDFAKYQDFVKQKK